MILPLVNLTSHFICWSDKTAVKIISQLKPHISRCQLQKAEAAIQFPASYALPILTCKGSSPLPPLGTRRGERLHSVGVWLQPLSWAGPAMGHPALVPWQRAVVCVPMSPRHVLSSCTVCVGGQHRASVKILCPSSNISMHFKCTVTLSVFQTWRQDSFPTCFSSSVPYLPQRWWLLSELPADSELPRWIQVEFLEPLQLFFI